MLLSADGRVVYSYSGRLEQEDMDVFFGHLSTLLGVNMMGAPRDAHP
jgi:hypothetical protein